MGILRLRANPTVHRWRRLGAAGILMAVLFTLVSFPDLAVAQASAQDARMADLPAGFPAWAARYGEARALLDSDPARAYQLAQKLGEDAESDALVADRRLDLAATAAQNAGMVDAAIAAFEALAEATTQPLDQLHAHVARGELLLLQGRLEECARAIAAADAVAAKARGSAAQSRYFRARRWRLQHDLMLARAHEAGQGADSGAQSRALGQARQAAKTLLLDFPDEPDTRRDGLALDEESLDSAQLFRRARVLYQHWAYHDARRIFEKLVDEPKYRTEAQWHLAQLALNKLRDRPAEAEKLFAALAEDGPHQHEALFQLARAQMNQERYDDALQTFDRYQKRYPSGSYTESIYYYRGWLPYDHRQNAAAIDGFKAYIARYGKRARHASYVWGFLAWTYIREGRWQDAIDVYRQMDTFGNMLVWGKALYWQAYATHQLQDTEGALNILDRLRKTYPVTYYGMLGEQLRARILGQDERASQVWWPEDAATPEQAAREFKQVHEFRLGGLSPGVAKTWQRVQALVTIDEAYYAREAASSIQGALLAAVPAGERDAWIHAYGAYIEDYHPMWRMVAGGSIAAFPRPPKPGTLEAQMAYPRAYPDVVQAVADEFDLPAELMWSIMRQESRYRPAQVSYTDAVGALQMIPRTARKVARDLGIVYNPRTFPRPSVGFRYSGYYLRKLLDTFSGLIVPAASAYNSGPKIVAYWFRHNPRADFAWLIEEFAYNEGRNYGRKVAEHLLRYLYLYEPDAERRGQVLDRMFPLSRDIELVEDVGY